MASRQERYRVEMVAATETAQAFGAEREWVGGKVWPLFSGLSTQPHKVWCAELDERCCGACSQAHGEVRRLDEPFAAGDPGAMHPKCRCWEDIIWLVVSQWEAA